MKLADKFVVNVPLERVWEFVTNPDNFIKIIPDVQKYEKIDDKNFKTTFKIGLGMIKGSINMTFRLEDLNPPNSLKVVGRGSGMQSTADLTLALQLTPANGGTEVSWSADLMVGGLVASVGSRLLESTTKNKVKEIVDGLKRELEAVGKKKK